MITGLDSCSVAPDAIISVLTSSGYTTTKRMTVCSTVQEDQEAGMIMAYLMFADVYMR